MSWFKIDDGFWSHPKTADLSGDAVALWVRAGSYCCQHLTDGFVSPGSLRFLGSSADADELVDSGLWVTADGGYQFHDWDEYQETSDAVRRRRDMARERQRRARAAREQKRHNQLMSQVASPDESRRDGAESSQEVFNPRPDPTRPDLLTTDVVSSALPRETRRRRPMPIPDDWAPTDTHRAKLGHLPAGIDLAAEADAFRNHALANDRRLVDWNAGFHNWLGKARPRPVPGQGAATTKAQGWVDLAHQFTDQPEQKAIR